MLDLHFWPTPNGRKVVILLEECGLPYRIVPVNIGRGDQFKPEFLKMNPNHRMPVLVDNAPAVGSKPVVIFESGAIMLYIAEKTGRFLPKELHARYDVIQWVFWQMANQGPKYGECGTFLRLGDQQGDQSFALRRFTNEVNRLMGVMNNQLYAHRYLAADTYTIADMICYPWALLSENLQQNLDEFKYLKRWLREMEARPAVQKGMAVGADLSGDLSTLTEEQMATLRKTLYNQRALPAPDKGSPIGE